MRRKIFKTVMITGAVTAVVTAAALLTIGAAGTGSRGVSTFGRTYGAPAEPLKGALQESYSELYTGRDLIRFHVIANSDSDRDQALKRRIRDLVVRQMTPEFEKAATLDEARRTARAHLGEIQAIAEKEVGAWGESYQVTVQLGRFDFPVKTYGNLTLPAGEYEAVRVVIGRGQGANWWCVLFPPLCFVDVSKTMAPTNTEYTAASVYAQTGIVQTFKGTGSRDLRPVEVERQTYKIRFRLLEILGLSPE